MFYTSMGCPRRACVERERKVRLTLNIITNDNLNLNMTTGWDFSRRRVFTENSQVFRLLGLQNPCVLQGFRNQMHHFTLCFA